METALIFVPNIPKIQDEDIHVYANHMLISNESFEEYLSCIRNIFEYLYVSNMTLKLSKYEFIRTKNKYLGHIIISINICMDPTKIQVVCEFLYHTVLRNYSPS